MRVEVVRRGGLAGIPLRGSVETADKAASVALHRLGGGSTAPPHPDGFQYELSSDGRSVVLNENDIPAALRPLIDAALSQGTLG